MSLITTRKLINGEKVTIRCEYISMGWWVAKADDYERRNGHGQSAEAAADDLTIELNNLAERGMKEIQK